MNNTMEKPFAAVVSRMVNKFRAEPMRCPSCGWLPIQVGFFPGNGAMRIRFECPNEECKQQPPAFTPSHDESVEAWNALTLHDRPRSAYRGRGTDDRQLAD